MNHPSLKIFVKILSRKLAVILLIAVTAAASFATLGDGNKNSGTSKTSSLLSSRTNKPGYFSLRSGYTYRGNQVISQQSADKYISLNTTVTYQKGNTTYIIPLKKKVLLSNIKIDISNRQFHRN